MYSDRIFVFGSNYAGRHGAGAARYALEHQGARYGIGVGLYGRSYAIPTKDENIITLPRSVIQYEIDHFLTFSWATRRVFAFNITRIGCGLAGYTDEQIAPMFIGAHINCHFYEEWRKWFPDQADLGPSPK